MGKENWRAGDARLLFPKTVRPLRINERPGQVVCMCETSGNVSLWDPVAYWRTEKIRRREEKERRRNDDSD